MKKFISATFISGDVFSYIAGYSINGRALMESSLEVVNIQ